MLEVVRNAELQGIELYAVPRVNVLEIARSTTNLVYPVVSIFKADPQARPDGIPQTRICAARVRACAIATTATALAEAVVSGPIIVSLEAREQHDTSRS